MQQFCRHHPGVQAVAGDHMSLKPFGELVREHHIGHLREGVGAVVDVSVYLRDVGKINPRAVCMGHRTHCYDPCLASLLQQRQKLQGECKMRQVVYGEGHFVTIGRKLLASNEYPCVVDQHIDLFVFPVQLFRHGLHFTEG